MDNSTALNWIQAGAIYHLLFALFHLMFWRLFRWREQLERLHPVNRGIMQVLNLRLTYVFLVFAALSWLFPQELLSTPLGQALCLAIALFWLMRALEQLIFFTRHLFSGLLFLTFVVGAVLYGWPWFSTLNLNVLA